MTTNTDLQQFELVAIDLDGTLVDSVGDLHAAVNQMQRDLSLTSSTISEVATWVGNGIERLVQRALTGSMQDDAEASVFRVAMPLFEKAYAQCNGSKSRLYPGVLQGLDWLHSLDVPLVVVTNKAGRFATPLVAALGIDRYFSHLVAGDDVVAKKPQPDALIEAAKRTAANPHRSILIGDSMSDAKAARAADFLSVTVSYGYNHGVPVTNLLNESLTDAVIDSFSELPLVFRQITEKNE